MIKTILAAIMMMSALVMTASPAEASGDVNAYMPKKQLCKGGDTIIRVTTANNDDRDHTIRWEFYHGNTYGTGGAYRYAGGKSTQKYIVEAGDEFTVSVWMDEKKDKRLLLSRTVVAKDCS